MGLIIDASDPSWSWYIKYKMPDNDVVLIDSSALKVTGYYSGVGTVKLGLAVRPGTGDFGDGTFQPASYFVSGSGAYSLTAGDFNADGKPDLAIADQFSNSVSILLNTTP